jgi:hypothetical protein
MARARAPGGSYKSARTKEDREIARWLTAGEKIAAADPTFIEAVRSSLSLYDKTAEERLIKHFPEWFANFAPAIQKDKNRTQAWEQLKMAFDLDVLVQLYLFTYPGKTTTDVIQDAFRFLRDGLDKLLPKYDALCKATLCLINDPKVKFLKLISEKARMQEEIFDKPIRFIRAAQADLTATRDYAKQAGSHKIDAHDHHLYLVAKTVFDATGKYHFAQIATLVEAANVAHGKRDEIVTEDQVKQRVYRYTKRTKVPHV